MNELNTAAIEQNKDKLTLLYGEADQWCPPEIYQRNANLFPDLDLRLCLGKIRHAFVVSRESTLQICDIINEIIQNIKKIFTFLSF